MTNLSEFLLARIAEDEAVARGAVARNGATWSTDELSDGTRIAGTAEFGNPRSYRGDSALWDDEGAMGMFAETAAHVAHWDPARVLAECMAKRAVVAYCTPHDDMADALLRGLADPTVDRDALVQAEPFARLMGRVLDEALTDVLKTLALPYAAHPDYDEAWRP